MDIPAEAEAAIVRWHAVVNAADSENAQAAVADPIIVNGPKGAGPISPAGFADWIARSGITLHARSYHPISDRVLVVEQDARWPQSDSPTRVATMFRVTGDQVSAALRFPDLNAALEFAHLYRALATTENA